MDPYFVSIIIPAYNCEKWIKETIDSVLNQTYSNYELIIIDDGSTDTTKKIIDSYNDPRIQYHYKKNSGLGLPSIPRNVGVQLAKGEIIAMLDHDDVWFPTKLEKQISILKNDSTIDFVFTNAYKLFDNNKTEIPMLRDIKPGVFNVNQLIPMNKVIQSTAMIKKALLIKFNGFNEDVDLKGIEDYDLWCKIYQEHKGFYTDECLIHYRIHGNQTGGNALKAINREVIFYDKYWNSYGFPKNLNQIKSSDLYYRLGMIQISFNDPTGKKNLRKAFSARKNLKTFSLYVISFAPFKALNWGYNKLKIYASKKWPMKYQMP